MFWCVICVDTELGVIEFKSYYQTCQNRKENDPRENKIRNHSISFGGGLSKCTKSLDDYIILNLYRPDY